MAISIYFDLEIASVYAISVLQIVVCCHGEKKILALSLVNCRFLFEVVIDALFLASEDGIAQ